MSLDFSVTYSFRPYNGPGVDSAPSENEYQEHFLGVKAACAWGWQPHHLHVPNIMKSGSLNFLEPCGPHRACYWTGLPFILLWRNFACETLWFHPQNSTIRCGLAQNLRFRQFQLLLLLFSRLYNVSTSSCAHLTIIVSSPSSCLCHSSLLPSIPFLPSVL